MPDQAKKDKIETARDALRNAHDVADMGKTIAPPGVAGRIQDAEDFIEIADQGLSIWQRIKAKFGKKKAVTIFSGGG